MNASTHQEGWFCSPKLQASERMGETPTIKGQPGKVKKEKCSDTLATTLFSKKTWTGLTLFVPYLHRLMASYNRTHSTHDTHHASTVPLYRCLHRHEPGQLNFLPPRPPGVL